MTDKQTGITHQTNVRDAVNIRAKRIAATAETVREWAEDLSGRGDLRSAAYAARLLRIADYLLNGEGDIR